MDNIKKRLKKGFTLIELVAVMVSTSVIMVGFTLFTIFFSNQYNFEMNINKTTNSAITLRYSISNNIDRYNYTFESDEDFSNNTYNQESKTLSLFSTVTPIEHPNLENVYKGVIIKDYYFKKQIGEIPSHFAYTEKIYTFTSDVDLKTGEHPTALRDKIGGLTPEVEDFIIYQTLSRMVLTFEQKEHNSTSNCTRYQFTIQYDFASDDVEIGTKQLIFDKYIYYR